MSINCRDASYTIQKVDTNTEDITVNRGQIDQTSLDITLLGKRRREYGEIFNENLLRILENFSSPEDGSNPGNPDPNFTNGGVLSNPTSGQLWHNSTDDRIYHFTGFEWKILGELGDVAGNFGTIMSGEQLPRPVSVFTGYVFPYEECSWVVAPAYYDDEIEYMACYTDDQANVTFEYRRVGESSLVSGSVTYQIIGIRDNNSLGVQVTPTPPPSVSPTPSASLTPTPTPTQSVSASAVAATPTPTPTASVTGTPGASPPATPTPTPTPSPTPSVTSSQTPTPTPTPSSSTETFGNVEAATYTHFVVGGVTADELSIRFVLQPNGDIDRISTIDGVVGAAVTVGTWVVDPSDPGFVPGDYTYTTVVTGPTGIGVFEEPTPATGGTIDASKAWELSRSTSGSGTTTGTVAVTLTPGGGSSSFTGGTITFEYTLEKT